MRGDALFRIGALGILGLLGLLVLAGCEGQDRNDRQPQSLLEALEGYRPFPLRLTGGFAHAPCPQEEPPRCAPLPSGPALRRLEAAQRRARYTSIPTLRGPAPVGGVGTEGAVQQLVLHSDGQSLREAVSDLELAAAADPDNADLNSNLAVAFAAQSEIDERYHGALRFRAFAAAAQAVHLDENHPEALFNLALLQAELGLRRPAAETWDRFLEVETDPAWRSEAEDHRARVTAPREIDAWAGEDLEAAAAADDEDEFRRLVQLSPILTRTHLQQELFPAWGEGYLAGDLGAAEAARKKLAAIVPILTEVVRDWEAADNLAILTADPGNPESERRRRALAAGLVGLRELQELPRGCPEDRYRGLEETQHALEQAGSGSAAWAGWGLGVCEQYRQRLDRACTLLESVAAKLDPQRHPIALAYLLRQWAFDAELAGGLDQAMRIYADAFALSTSEPATAQSIAILRVSLLQRLGLVREAWNLRYELLGQLEALPWNNAAAGLMAETAYFLNADGHPAAALPFQDQEVAQKATSGIPSWQAYAHAARAQIRQVQGDWEAADRDLATMQRNIQEEEGERRARLQRLLEETQARSLLQKDPEAAQEKLALAEERGRRAGEREKLAETLLLTADLHRLRGETGRLEERLREWLDLKEDLFRGIQDAGTRRVAVAGLWPQVRERITLLVEEHGAYEEAFELADAARSRAFLEEIGAPPPQSVPQLIARLPADTALIHYLTLETGTLCWVLTARGLEFFRLDLTAQQSRALEGEVQAALGATSTASQANAWDLLATLHDRLIEPFAGTIAGLERLVFVSLDGLDGVPFAALANRRTGRYLVEDFTLSRATSASSALALAQRRRQRGPWRPRSVLAVGDPQFNRTLYPFLPSLEQAAPEARAVAEVYGAEPPLLGVEANLQALRRRLETSDIFHFAGHALAGAEPALLLASDADHRSGTLLGNDLEAVDMPRLRLAVLSACETAAAGEAADTQGLVRPFLTAGADSVVASLWKVRDEPTRELMVRFHAQVAGGGDPIVAFRKARLSMLASEDPNHAHPMSWGGFVKY